MLTWHILLYAVDHFNELYPVFLSEVSPVAVVVIGAAPVFVIACVYVCRFLNREQWVMLLLLRLWRPTRLLLFADAGGDGSGFLEPAGLPPSPQVRRSNLMAKILNDGIASESALQAVRPMSDCTPMPCSDTGHNFKNRSYRWVLPDLETRRARHELNMTSLHRDAKSGAVESDSCRQTGPLRRS